MSLATAAAIRDQIISLITAISPTLLGDDKFRAYRNERAADFDAWAEANTPGCLRRFQVRESSDDGEPDVSNMTEERVRVTFEIRIAYPQTHRYGRDGALDRDDVANDDWKQIKALVGASGRANFSGANDCTPLGATKTTDRSGVEGVDLMIITAEYEYVRRTNIEVPNQTPTAAFSFVANGLDVAFTDESTDADGTITQWFWDFGDGGSSTEQNPTHTYASAGTYAVQLTVLDDDNTIGTVSQDVTVS